MEYKPAIQTVNLKPRKCHPVLMQDISKYPACDTSAPMLSTIDLFKYVICETHVELVSDRARLGRVLVRTHCTTADQGQVYGRRGTVKSETVWGAQRRVHDLGYGRGTVLRNMENSRRPRIHECV